MTAGEVLAAIVGLILGIIGNYLFESLGLRTRAAKTSTQRARKRHSELTTELAEIQRLHDDPVMLISLVVGRILLVSMLWIGQEVLDYMLGLVANGTYSYFILTPESPNFSIEALTSTVNAAASGIDALLLVLVLNIAYRGYRTWRRATRFVQYKAKTQAALAELEAVIEDGRTEGSVGGDSNMVEAHSPPDHAPESEETVVRVDVT